MKLLKLKYLLQFIIFVQPRTLDALDDSLVTRVNIEGELGFEKSFLYGSQLLGYQFNKPDHSSCCSSCKQNYPETQGFTYVIDKKKCVCYKFQKEVTVKTKSYDGVISQMCEYHPCDRECVPGSHRTCYYKFVVEQLSTMGKACVQCPNTSMDCYRPQCMPGDGVERSIVVANRSLPGPGIVVCDGDRVVVDVENNLPATVTSIHWHGQTVREAPWNDGMPYVTQCPILPHSSFRYNFTVGPVGTYFWHSHTPLQREEGLSGKFIVRQADVDNVQRGRYEEDRTDHVIIIQEWYHNTSQDMFRAHHYADGTPNPQSFLVNGKGRFRRCGGLYTPVEVFNVEPGRKYRFRVINAGIQQKPVEMTVEGHKLEVIASDGMDIEPIEEVTKLTIHNGERYDVVIDTNKKESKIYLIKFMWRIFKDDNGDIQRLYGVALLRYGDIPITKEVLDQLEDDKDSYDNDCNQEKEVNAVNIGQGNEQKISVADFRDAVKSKKVKEKANKTIFLSWDFMKITNPHFDQDFYSKKIKTPLINGVSNIPPSSPMLSQFDQIDKKKVCNYETPHIDEHCNQDGFCECHHIIELGLNEVVDIFLIEEGHLYDVSHPFHLHGHHFHVIAMERFGNKTRGNEITREKVIEMNSKEMLMRPNLENPPLKDSIMIPDAGYTLVRLKADNPGYWFFHCHMSWHVEYGMSLVFKVGNDLQIPPTPKGFPTCGNFQ